MPEIDDQQYRRDLRRFAKRCGLKVPEAERRLAIFALYLSLEHYPDFVVETEQVRAALDLPSFAAAVRVCTVAGAGLQDQREASRFVGSN